VLLQVIISPGQLITGPTVSDLQLIVLIALDVLPQASVAFQILDCVRLHPLLVTEPSDPVSGSKVAELQLSVAFAVPSAELICIDIGLHPKLLPFETDPVVVITGGVKSTVQVAVRDVLAVFPHPSITVHVLVLERWHPKVVVTPSVEVGVTVPQLSVAVAVPKAASIVAAKGLQPGIAPFAGVPVAVITGAAISKVQVAVRELLAVFPHPSVAVHVLVCER